MPGPASKLDAAVENRNMSGRHCEGRQWYASRTFHIQSTGSSPKAANIWQRELPAQPKGCRIPSPGYQWRTAAMLHCRVLLAFNSAHDSHSALDCRENVADFDSCPLTFPASARRATKCWLLSKVTDWTLGSHRARAHSFWANIQIWSNSIKVGDFDNKEIDLMSFRSIFSSACCICPAFGVLKYLENQTPPGQSHLENLLVLARYFLKIAALQRVVPGS